MSFPRSVSRFVPWSKAMVAGATVDKPDYGKSSKKGSPKAQRSKRKKRRRRRRKKNATKET